VEYAKNTYAPRINIASDIMTVIFLPSNSIEGNIKRAPKKPPAESINFYVSTSEMGIRSEQGNSKSYRY
jgi:hypothetical protein